MYERVIEHADKTLTANTRLRAETRALLIRYRAHRFARISGGSDGAGRDHGIATNVMTRIRAKVIANTLPAPAEIPLKCYVGKGTRRPCDGCDEVVTPDQIEYELDITNDRTLRFHETCLTAWHTIRTERTGS